MGRQQRRNYARENNSSEATVYQSRLFAEGAFKNVYEGTYTKGPRRGQPCVSKIFKTGSTIDIVNRFNENQFVDKEIWVNRPTIWSYVSDGEKSLVEPMIENFEKFYSNSGWTPTYSTVWTDVMQALSHYSYHTNDRRAMICDLQGGIYQDGFILTDPVVMSTTKEYGPTDLGPDGISTFFARHQCNSYCRPHWIFPNNIRSYFPEKKGTSMVMPLATRHSRAPLTRFNGIAEESDSSDSDYY